ncbi:MAG: GNAT family N-acetyltransferase [Coriobacteriales bacterium]|jgi:phosphinothricin acetyltransferase|nr:GNAT family N-acetyltransferase [Coriobacteriales bacterium]
MSENSKVSLRLAQLDDAQAIIDIYKPYVIDTAITFTSKVPTVADVQKTMADIKKHYPYLVCEIDNQVVGFAYANKVRPQEAYRWNAELSIYINPAFHGRGIATALYTALFSILKVQGYCNLYAVITMPNDASVALHRHFGFNDLGIHGANGYKLGAWRDVLWMEYRIPGAIDPGAFGNPLPLDKVKQNDIDTALALAAALLSGAQR